MVRTLLLLLIVALSPPSARADDLVRALTPSASVLDRDQPGRVHGELIDARLRGPRQGVIVALFRPQGDGRRWPEPWVADFPDSDEAPIATVTTGHEGQYLFEGLAPGRYRVAPLVPHHELVTRRDVIVTRETPSVWVPLGMSLGARLEGVVRVPDGLDPVDVYVFIVGRDDGQGGNTLGGRGEGGVRAGPDGAFAIAHVEPGRVRLQAGRRDIGFSEPMLLDLEVAQDVVGLALEVPDHRERIARGRAAGGGIGVVVDFDGGGAVVRRVLEGLPAEGAGLLVGDRMLAIAGRSTQWMMRFEFFNLARGEIGEPVTVTVSRDGGPPRDVVLERAKMPER